MPFTSAAHCHGRLAGVALALALAAAPTESAEGKYFLTFAGHTMEQDKIEITHISPEPREGVRQFVLTRAVDRSSPKLESAYKDKRRFPTATLFVSKSGPPLKYEEFVLHDVRIRDYQLSGRSERVVLECSRTTPPAKIEVPNLKVTSTDPVPHKPGRGGPLQSPPEPALKAPGGAAQPDLLPEKGLTLGSKNTFIAWGQTAVLSSDAASAKQAGRCQFRYRYTSANQGKGAAAATTNRIRLDADNGPVLAEAPLPALAAGAQHTSSGTLPLAIGTWTLYVHVDDPKQVAESDEQNNLRRVRVRVEGDCQ